MALCILRRADTSLSCGGLPWTQGPFAPQRLPCVEASDQMSFHESSWSGDWLLYAFEEMEITFPKLNTSSLPGAFYMWTDSMMQSKIFQNICQMYVSIEKSATKAVTVFPCPMS